MGWENGEMATSDIGDKRLDKRAKKIVCRLTESPGSSFTESLKGRAELVAACRFFDNARVTPEKILSSHFDSTRVRIKGHPVILCPNDTSSIDFTNKPSVEGLGILESSFTHGFLIHPTLAFTPDKECLGCIQFKTWARNGEAKRKSLPRDVRSNQPIEEKESFRWVESFRAVNELAMQMPETQFVNIGDRESDIYEYLSEAVQARESKNGAYMIVRINHDRKLHTESDEDKSVKRKKSKQATVEDIETQLEPELEIKLKKALLSAPVMGEVTFEMSSRNKKPVRKVTQKIRAIQIKLTGKKVGDRIYPDVMINAVCSIEEAPPCGEQPICWMFFTTLPIDTWEQVHKVIKYYLCRWGIEVFFHVFKTGCKVEETELKTAERIQNMLALFVIVSWRIMYIMTLSRQKPNISCTEIFEEAEWKAVFKISNPKAPLPTEPVTLGELVLLIAILGGYQPRKGSPPGPKVIWRGLRRTHDYALAWETFGAGNA